MANAAAAMVAPTAPASAGEPYALLLKLTYDATGTKSVDIRAAPIVAWVYDQAAPAAGSAPVTLAAMPPAPPDTAPILSPQWAVIYPNNATVYAANDLFVGDLDSFLTWLATNNGADRAITSAQFATPLLVNIWNEWTREHPQIVQMS